MTESMMWVSGTVLVDPAGRFWVASEGPAADEPAAEPGVIGYLSDPGAWLAEGPEAFAVLEDGRLSSTGMAGWSGADLWTGAKLEDLKEVAFGVRLYPDYENNAEEFWAAVQSDSDAPAELADLPASVSADRAIELIVYCERQPGFAGGPPFAPTAIRFQPVE